MSNRKRRGRGESSIFQRANGLWVATVEVGRDAAGKRLRRSVAGSSKKEVQEKLKQLTANGVGPVSDADRLTVAEYLQTWLASIKPRVATHTYISYEQHYRNTITPYLGGVKLTKLTALNVEQFYASLAESGRSPCVQRKAAVTLTAALSRAVKLKLIPHNPARGVDKPKYTPKEMRVLDPEQVQSFFAEAKRDRLAALYIVAADSGAREGELFALNWNDVDWKTGAVQILRTLEEAGGSLAIKELKTKKSKRRIVLSAFAMEALAEHRKAMLAEGHYAADAPIFCDSEGKWLRKSNVLRRSFRPILKRAGLPPIRFYDLRHGCASLLLAGGTDVKTIQERLGHANATMTLNVYSHAMPGAQERAASKLDAIFRQSANGKAAVGSS
jgi:integrase